MLNIVQVVLVSGPHSFRNDSKDEILDCGTPVNFTYYDNLVGVLNRHKHPNIPEPQAALAFMKKFKGRKSFEDFDVDGLEQRLKKAKREKPKSVHLYTQIANYHRIRGHTLPSIECFRRALATAPHDPGALLALARLLFTLQYLDDAIYLTRRSLEAQTQPHDGGAAAGVWQQYFALGEILKAYGHYQEAAVHLRHALALRPGYGPALDVLKELEETPAGGLHLYTLMIIIGLVLGVLFVILSSVDNIAGAECTEMKGQRHFNRAMAMRSLRGFGVQKGGRSKKL